MMTSTIVVQHSTPDSDNQYTMAAHFTHTTSLTSILHVLPTCGLRLRFIIVLRDTGLLMTNFGFLLLYVLCFPLYLCAIELLELLRVAVCVCARPI